MWDANLKSNQFIRSAQSGSYATHILSLAAIQRLAAKEGILLAARGEALRTVETLATIVDVSMIHQPTFQKKSIIKKDWLYTKK